jgi:hypothetical protein
MSTTDLPFNPFARAAVGDWSVFRAVLATRIHQPTGVLTWRVEEIDGDDVVVAIEETIGGKKHFRLKKTFSRKRPPSLESYTAILFKVFPRSGKNDPRRAPRAISGVTAKAGKALELEPYVGEVFSGVKLSYRAVPFTSSHNGQFELWLSRKVKCPGVLHLTLDYGMAACGPGAHVTLAGYGTRARTSWGKSRDELTDLGLAQDVAATGK